KQGHRRVFLIDGVETAFRSEQLLRGIEGLFKFLLTVQSDPALAESVMIRLFLRTDLARRAFQNVEQQIAGRELTLAWNTQAIFNFVLSRVASLQWFRDNFADQVSVIEKNAEELRNG